MAIASGLKFNLNTNNIATRDRGSFMGQKPCDKSGFGMK